MVRGSILAAVVLLSLASNRSALPADEARSAARTWEQDLPAVGARGVVPDGRRAVKTAAGGLPLRVERGAFVGAEWKPEGAVRAETAGGEARFMLTDPQAVRIRW